MTHADTSTLLDRLMAAAAKNGRRDYDQIIARKNAIRDYQLDADFLAGHYTGVTHDTKGRICEANGIQIIYPKAIPASVRQALRSPALQPCLLMRVYVTPCQWSAGNPVSLMTRALVPLREHA